MNQPRATITANRVHKQSGTKYELVFERDRRIPSLSSLIAGLKAPATPTVSGLLAELKAIREKGGGAIGDAYARAASSVLERVERFEDLNAERKHRQRKSGRKLEAVSNNRKASV